jgi:hypothetical protein
MTPEEMSAALHALPMACQRALRRGDQVLVEEAARLRDELHAVANRVTRLLDVPGARLAEMDIGVPTPLAGPSSPQLVLALLTMAAERLADIADHLGEEEWRATGQLGSEIVTIGQLVEVPLHRAHRILSAPSGSPRNDTTPTAGVRDERAACACCQPPWRPPKRTQQ